MKPLALLFLAVAMLATVGCSKKDDGSTASTSSTMGGTGSTAVKTYSGAVATMDTTACLQDCKQTVSVNANVIDYPGDSVNVYLCRNADCSAGIPKTPCSDVSLNPTAACVTTIPSPDIILGKNTVTLLNAFKSYCVDQACTTSVPGYSSYLVQTVVTR